MKRTGELLKKTREEKKLSLHEVALFLKINSRVLQAIEDGDQSQLPARTFLRGFVQSYAKFLKLDPQFVLQVFSEETAPLVASTATELPNNSTQQINETVVSNSASAETTSTKEDRTEVDVISLEKSILTQSQVAQDKLGFKTVAISVLGLFLVVILYFANNVIKKYQKESIVAPVESITSEENQNTATTSPEEIAAQNTPTSNTSTSAAPLSTPVEMTTSIMIPTPHPTAVVETKPKPELVESKPPTPTPPPASAPISTEKPVATTVTTPPAAEKLAAKTEEGKLIEVIVEATDAVEIEYSSSKTTPQKMVLKADQIHTFKSRSGVRLKISNGGAVNIIMNGRDLGAPGAAGQPIQLTY